MEMINRLRALWLLMKEKKHFAEISGWQSVDTKDNIQYQCLNLQLKDNPDKLSYDKSWRVMQSIYTGSQDLIYSVLLDTEEYASIEVRSRVELLDTFNMNPASIERLLEKLENWKQSLLESSLDTVYLNSTESREYQTVLKDVLGIETLDTYEVKLNRVVGLGYEWEDVDFIK